MCTRWIQGPGREGRGHRLFSVIGIKLCNEPNSKDISLLAKEEEIKMFPLFLVLLMMLCPCLVLKCCMFQ